MSGTCGFSEVQLLHEVVSNLQSLQGAWVDWRVLEQVESTKWLVRVTDSEGNIFRFKIVLIEAVDSAAFDLSLEIA